MRMAAVLSVGRFRRFNTTERRIKAMMPTYDKVRGMDRCSPTVNPKIKTITMGMRGILMVCRLLNQSME